MRGLSIGLAVRWLPLSVAVAGAACASSPLATSNSDSAIASETSRDGSAPRGAGVEPDLVVEARDPAPESAVTCREMLRPGSNVIVRQCMTIADWKNFDRRQAIAAQQTVRRMQGSGYR